MAYCANCGAQISDQAQACPQCGHPVRPAVGNVPNYMVQAILVTIFCCLPFGIVSIVYASRVGTRLAAGDISGAMEASRNAKMWAWIAFAVGLGFILLGVITSVPFGGDVDTRFGDF